MNRRQDLKRARTNPRPLSYNMYNDTNSKPTEEKASEKKRKIQRYTSSEINAATTIQKWIRSHPWFVTVPFVQDAMMAEDIKHFRDILTLIEPNGCTLTFSAPTLCKHFLLTADFAHPLTRRELLLCEVMRACRFARLNSVERAVLLTTYANRSAIHDAIKSELSLISLLEADCGKILDKMMSLIDLESLSYEAMIRGCTSDLIHEQHSGEMDAATATANQGPDIVVPRVNEGRVDSEHERASVDAAASATSVDATIVEDLLDETICVLEMERDTYERTMRTLHRAGVTAYNQLQLHRMMFERRRLRLFSMGARKIQNTFQYISESLPIPGDQGYISGLEIWLKSIRR